MGMYGKKVLAGFSLLLFFIVLFTPASQAQQTGKVFITSLERNGEYWLIGGFYSSREEGVKQFLVKFDGEGFFDPVQEVNLRIPELTLEDLDWNGEYWLLSYDFEDVGELMKYDGSRFNIISLPDHGRVNGFDWNGGYWQIGGDGYLVKYDGVNVTDLTAEFTESTGLDGATSILWMNGTWLIMGLKEKSGQYYPTLTRRLVIYDGVNFYPLEESGAMGWFRRSSWNGEYLLLAFRDNLVKYDGKHLLNLTAQADFKSSITGLGWNGRYWLIGAFDGALKKYDGVSFKDIKGGRLKMIKAVRWGDKYWLIAGKGDDGLQKLLKYDGAVFKDITPQLKKALRYDKSTPTPIHREPAPQKPKRGVCGPTVVVLLALIPALCRRRTSRR